MKKPSSPHAGVPARDDRGFTLVELIVAIVILAIVFIPLLNAFVVGAKTHAKSSQQNNATIAAQNAIENIQAMSASSLESMTLNAAQTQATDYSNLKADVTVKADNAANNKSVAVSNRMDELIDMTSADEAAANQFSINCGGNVSAANLLHLMSRTIKISSTLTQVSGNMYTFSINVIFTYNGTVTYTVTTTNPDTNETVTTSCTGRLVNFEQKPAAPYELAVPVVPSPAKDAAYSIYLFYNPFYWDIGSGYGLDIDPVTINNNTNLSGITDDNYPDFNVFFVSTDKDSSMNHASYRPTIKYYGQHAITARVFTNTAFSGTHYARTYWAYKRNVTATYTTYPLDTVLVERKMEQRLYDISVTVYRADDADKTPIVTMTAQKLV